MDFAVHCIVGSIHAFVWIQRQVHVTIRGRATVHLTPTLPPMLGTCRGGRQRTEQGRGSRGRPSFLSRARAGHGSTCTAWSCQHSPAP